MVFLDEINRRNPTPGLGPIEATNPCGEQPLYPFESCNLGSINLAKLVRNQEIEWDRLRIIVRDCVDFLDGVIDVNRFPIPRITEMTASTRKIGLGVMGFAEMLIRLGIPYDSREALDQGDRTMAFIQAEGKLRSQELGEEKGSFSAIDRSIYSGAMRNSTVTTIAPTGSLHIIANTSSGIEPLFSLAYTRIIAGDPVEIESDLVRDLAREYPSRNIPEHVRRTGTVQDLNLPDDVKALYRTAPEIGHEQHVRMQAVFQKHVDNGVSKTVNMAETSTIGEISAVFDLARSLGCKGITIYRYNSKANQVMSRGCEICKVED
jgi:ribonucleoside-diphosphate reductase alpha chain